MKKRFLFIVMLLLIFVLTLVSSCGSNSVHHEKEFWEVDGNFQDTVTWNTYSYADAFSIMVPPYMRENQFELVGVDSTKLNNVHDNPFLVNKCTLSDKPLNSHESAFTSFSSKKDSIHNSYASIKIIYMKGDDGDFSDHLQGADLEREDSKQICDQLIKSQLGFGKLIKKRQCDMTFTQNGDMYLDICYQRVGNTKGEGPVTVHIFFIQNMDEAVEIVVSYHDKHHDVYKDLFNIIETFKWKKIRFEERHME